MDPHTLHVYAIGLKLVGISANTLKNYIEIYSATSSIASHPSQEITVPISYQLIGGGARVNWSGYGNLLVDSYPSEIRKWYAEGKDHLKASPATITVYAIGIRDFIPGFGYLDVAQQSAIGSYVTTGIASANIVVEDGWVLACIGANSTYSGYGRMLFNMQPLNGYNVLVQSKDHIKASAGYITGYITKIKKR